MAPQFVSSAASDAITVTEGDTVRVHCSVRGRPPPAVAWTVNGRALGEGPLADDDRVRAAVDESGCHTLIVRSARMGDQGEIVCVARNRSGESTFKVEKNYRTFLRHFKPFEALHFRYMGPKRDLATLFSPFH